VSKAEAAKAVEAQKTVLIGIGGALLGLGFLALVICVIFREALEEKTCVQDYTNEKSAKYVAIMCFSCWCWVMALLVGGVVVILLGTSIDDGAFYAACCRGSEACTPMNR